MLDFKTWYAELGQAIEDSTREWLEAQPTEAQIEANLADPTENIEEVWLNSAPEEADTEQLIEDHEIFIQDMLQSEYANYLGDYTTMPIDATYDRPQFGKDY